MSAAELPSLDPKLRGAPEHASAAITQEDQVDLCDVPHLVPVRQPVTTRHDNNVRDAMQAAGHWLGKAQAELRTGLESARRRVQKTSRATMERARREVHHMRADRPLQALAIAAGAAFVLGMAVRFWRSRNS